MIDRNRNIEGEQQKMKNNENKIGQRNTNQQSQGKERNFESLRNNNKRNRNR